MTTIQTPENERPMWEAVKKHEDLRAMVRDLGGQKLNIQNQLMVMRKSDPRRMKLVRDAQQIESTLQMLKQQCAMAGVERNKADHVLFRIRAEAAGVLSGAPTPATTSVASAPVKPALPLNGAQVKHLKLLAVRVRSDELKLSARIQSAEDFVAMILPFLREDS